MPYSFRGRTISKVAVVGSGQIGPDIALHFSKVLSPHDAEVVVVDVSDAALRRGRERIEKKIRKGVESGAFTQPRAEAMLAALRFTTDYAELEGFDLAVEAATEDADLKARIFEQLEALTGDEALLLSNSSHLEPERIFERVRRRERSAVAHYFFPAERNPIVEIVSGADTDPRVRDWLLAFYEDIGKVPIPVRSRYGYAIDPIFEGLFLASALLVEEGVADTRTVDWVARRALGLTVGSFTAMNLTGGNPITAVGLDEYHRKIHGWFRTPDLLRRALEEGKPWDVPARGETLEVDPEVERRIADDLRGAYFGLAGEIVDAGVADLSDLDMAVEIALDVRAPFRFMNELGPARALDLVRRYAERHPPFPVPRCIEEAARRERPFPIRRLLRRDVDGIAVLTIRRPKKLNALDLDLFEEIREEARRLREDDSVRAVVLTGFGRKAFVSGADVEFLACIEGPEEGERTARRSQTAFQEVADLGKPVVCALNGLAFGGGNELAMCATVRIARKGLSPFVAQPEVMLGIIPGAGGTQRLPRLIGLERAQRMLRLGRPISSEEALEYGLISEEVEGDLLERALEWARDLAEGRRSAPEAPTGPLPEVPERLPDLDLGHLSRRVDEILCRAILEGGRLPLEEGLKVEARCFGEVCGTKDMRIGVENFLRNGPRSPAPFVHE